jgi:hypothetical protein
MSTSIMTPSNVAAKTQFLQAKDTTYAYRRFGSGAARPLLFLQHFTGTLDNWDPAVTDTLAAGREVILFDNAGIGGSTGRVPETVQGMAAHALAFLDALGLTRVDLLGFSRCHGRAGDGAQPTLTCAQNATGWYRTGRR